MPAPAPLLPSVAPPRGSNRRAGKRRNSSGALKFGLIFIFLVLICGWMYFEFKFAAFQDVDSFSKRTDEASEGTGRKLNNANKDLEGVVGTGEVLAKASKSPAKTRQENLGRRGHGKSPSYRLARHKAKVTGKAPELATTENDVGSVSVVSNTKETASPVVEAPVVAPVVSPAISPVVSPSMHKASSPQQNKVQADGVKKDAPTGLFALSAVDIDGNTVPLSKYQGAKATIVVNVASACGYTDANYKGLVALYSKYHSQGLEILGFPCNQFGKQESKGEADIKSFCTDNYGVNFPMFSKLEVNGPNTHPVYQFLKKNLPSQQGGGGGEGPGEELVWNFQKIFVNSAGWPEVRMYQDYTVGNVERQVMLMLGITPTTATPTTTTTTTQEAQAPVLDPVQESIPTTTTTTQEAQAPVLEPVQATTTTTPTTTTPTTTSPTTTAPTTTAPTTTTPTTTTTATATSGEVGPSGTTTTAASNSMDVIPSGTTTTQEEARAPVLTTNPVESAAIPLPQAQAQTSLPQAQAQTVFSTATSLYELTAVGIDGTVQDLSQFKGKVTLVVNVASECGYTDSNYKGLVETYRKYKKHGLEILAFPCNQFGQQEPKSEAEIKSFCADTFGVDFPMFSKVEVNGPNTSPVYQFLKKNLPFNLGGGGGSGTGQKPEIKWNFEKFVVDQRGMPVLLLPSDFVAADLELEIYRLLHIASV